MTRFSDEWVVDRSVFEYMQDGSCQCCGAPQLFNVDGIKGLIEECTDLETDAATAELNASPWPPKMREEVWADRVKLRLRMKREMKRYKEFFRTYDVRDVQKWCLETLGVAGLHTLFHIPRSEISQTIGNTHGIHSAYAEVLCSVADQVANFELTKYDIDARGEEEIDFEVMLYCDHTGGFVLPMNDEIAEEVIEAYLQYMVTLGGPKLLARAPSRVSDNNESDDGEDDEGGPDDAPKASLKNQRSCPSFRADRRLVRLLIGRHWADRIIDQYTDHVNSLKDELTKVEEETKVG